MVKLIQRDPGLAGCQVTGAIVCRGTDNYQQINAQEVVLATGGFQGNAQLRSQHLGWGADGLFVRSNAGSVGDGLQLAGVAGAGTSSGMGTYYGHLMPAPLREEDVLPEDFLALAQYRELSCVSWPPHTADHLVESKHCLLIDEAGRQFVDETMGDEIINQYLAKQEKQRGFLIFKYARSFESIQCRDS